MSAAAACCLLKRREIGQFVGGSNLLHILHSSATQVYGSFCSTVDFFVRFTAATHTHYLLLLYKTLALVSK